MISIHALREEGDREAFFLRRQLCISIHALREEGDAILQEKRRIMQISIHALREEGDSDIIQDYVLEGKFLSTPSARRATRCG